MPAINAVDIDTRRDVKYRPTVVDRLELLQFISPITMNDAEFRANQRIE